jgi:hypothetical protein
VHDSELQAVLDKTPPVFSDNSCFPKLLVFSEKQVLVIWFRLSQLYYSICGLLGF